jgi:hypothetical protein
MCQPLDPARVKEARLTATMRADAHCMKVIREFVLGDTGEMASAE